jgi:endonuclease/exonuclease/phosphatase family metal-dependent hydrolase
MNKLTAIIWIAVAAGLSGCASLPKPDFAPPGQSLRVVTYNVNIVGDARRIVGFLDEARADIVCLQETHPHWERTLRQLSSTYPHMHFHHAPGCGGIAVLSRHPLHEPTIMQADKAWFPALYVKTTTPLGEIGILNVHLKPPLSEKRGVSLGALLTTPGVHLEEIETYLGQIDLNLPTIVAGDINEHDNGKACKRLEESGFVNALRLFDRKSPTWRWPLGFGLELKNRYDHIFTSPDLQCTGAKVFNLRASDHEPVLAVIRNRQP